MTPSELYDFVAIQFGECYHMMKQKNADYGADSDPFKNFRKYGEMGILVRLSDKISRLETLLHKEPSVTEEKELDTIQDAINYLALYAAFRFASKRSPCSLPGSDVPGAASQQLSRSDLETGEVRGLVYGDPRDEDPASDVRAQGAVLRVDRALENTQTDHRCHHALPRFYPG